MSAEPQRHPRRFFAEQGARPRTPPNELLAPPRDDLRLVIVRLSPRQSVENLLWAMDATTVLRSLRPTTLRFGQSSQAPRVFASRAWGLSRQNGT